MELLRKIENDDFTGIDEFINQLLDLEISDSLVFIQSCASKLNTEQPNEAEQYMLILLQSFWNFFQSQVSIIEKADFQQGLQQIEQAHQGFQQLQLQEFQELAEGFSLYYSAVVDLKQLNLNSAFEKVNSAKKHFERIDHYGKHFSKQVEVFESESLFVSGVTSMMQLDLENGQIAIEKASSMSKKVAKKHCQEDSPEYNLFMGLGYFYSSYSSFILQSMHVNSLNFEYFDFSDNEASHDSDIAIDFLSKSIELGQVANINLNLAKGINLLAHVIFTIGATMSHILADHPENINFESNKLKINIGNANKFFRMIGDSGIVGIRLCKQVEQQLMNVSRYIRQKRIDPKPIQDTQWAFDDVKELLVQGKTEKALKTLLAKSMDFDAFNDIVLLNNRYARLKKERMLQLLTEEDFRVQETQVSKSVLDMLELL